MMLMPHTDERPAPAPFAASARSAVPAAGPEADVHFRVLFDSNPCAVLRLDRQGRIVECNPAVQARFGHAPASLRGQPLAVLVPDWDRPDLLADLSQHGKTHEALVRHAQGQRCEAVVALLPWPAWPVAAQGGDSLPGGYFLIARDVTPQRRLRRQMQVQAEILARIRDAVVVLDEAGHVVCWNGGAERLYGPTAQAMAGQPFAPLFAPAQRERLQQALDDTRFGAPAATELALAHCGPRDETAVLRLTLSRIAASEPGRELWVVQGQALADPLRADVSVAAPVEAEAPEAAAAPLRKAAPQ